MAKKAVNPGVGTGHGIRVQKERVCKGCGAGFMAVRSDALYCYSCGNKRKSRSFERRKAHACIDCRTPVVRRASRCQPCRGKWLVRESKMVREENPFWKGGRTVHHGYVRILNPNPPPRYIGEHVLVWTQVHGPIPRGWVVHHLNGDKADNRIENLVALNRSDHHSVAHAAGDVLAVHIRALEARIRELEGNQPI